MITKVPASFGDIPRKERAAALSRLAREALFRSARISGALPIRLEKDDGGAPLPFEGTYWSLSHKETFVAGVAAPSPVGIDLEQIKPVLPALFRKTGSEEEWGLGAPSDLLFYRYWTAKEAVLKTTGAGYREFSDCRVVEIASEKILRLVHRRREWRVEQFFFQGHMAAIILDDWEVDWNLIDAELQESEEKDGD